MITGDQIRAARKLLGWDRGKLAALARGVTTNTIAKAEGDKLGSPPTPQQLVSIREVLEAAGVEFADGIEPGVKLKRTRLQGGPHNAEKAGMITGAQVKAARALLGWTPYRLAPRAGMGHTLLRQFEAGARVLDSESAARLMAALQEAGVIFTGGGVKLRRSLRGGVVPDQLNADKDS